MNNIMDTWIDEWTDEWINGWMEPLNKDAIMKTPL